MLGLRHSWLRTWILTLAGLLLASGATWAQGGGDKSSPEYRYTSAYRAAPADYGMTIAGLQPSFKDNMARLLVVVPENAELWFNGAKTQQTGPLREFVSPQVPPGKHFRYEVKARWKENGKTVEYVRKAHFQANDWQTIDFTKPESSYTKAEE